MICVRPTLRALRDLPDSQLPPSVVEVLQRAQREGDRETKYRILSELDLCLLDHPLLDKARTMVTAGRLDKHESSSDALGKPVYEVRLPGGAAWRGALIRDGSTYWLVHVDTHDEFHKSAAKRIGDGAVMPTTLDRNLHERERTRRGVNTERIDAIGVILQSLSNAIEAGHSSSEVLVPGSSESALVRISVEHDHSTESATPTHELAGLLSITVTGTGQAAGLNDLLRRLAIFLQPDPDAIEQGYDEKGGVVLSMLVTHAKLIQVHAFVGFGSCPPETRRPTFRSARHATR